MRVASRAGIRPCSAAMAGTGTLHGSIVKAKAQRQRCIAPPPQRLLLSHGARFPHIGYGHSTTRHALRRRFQKASSAPAVAWSRSPLPLSAGTTSNGEPGGRCCFNECTAWVVPSPETRYGAAEAPRERQVRRRDHDVSAAAKSREHMQEEPRRSQPIRTRIRQPLPIDVIVQVSHWWCAWRTSSIRSSRTKRFASANGRCRLSRTSLPPRSAKPATAGHP